MHTKQKTNWWIDLVLFAGFITTFTLDLTGVELHQWIGILGGALAAFHLFIHRAWVGAVSKRFFGKTSGQARIYFSLDAFLLLGFTLIIVTGLGISTWLNLPLGNFSTCLSIHITISILTLVILLLKLVLHWRWIAHTARQIWPSPVTAPAVSTVTQAGQVCAASMGRREFLQVMGVTGAASFLALILATNGLAETIAPTEDVAAGDINAVVEAAAVNDLAVTNESASSSTSSSSTVRCQRGCSYPGHCHRYVDNNNNNRCDFGGSVCRERY